MKNKFYKKLLIITNVFLIATIPSLFLASCSSASNDIYYDDLTISSIDEANKALNKINEINDAQFPDNPLPYAAPTGFNEEYDLIDNGKTWINTYSSTYIEQINQYTLGFEIIGYMANHYINDLMNKEKNKNIESVKMSLNNFSFNTTNKKVNLEIKIHEIFKLEDGSTRHSFTTITIQQADIWYDIMPVEKWETTSYPCLKLQAKINIDNKIIQMGYNFGFLYENYHVKIIDIKPETNKI